MNDFFLANNRSITIGDITVHQLQMLNFDEWAPHAKAIKDFLKNHHLKITIKKKNLYIYFQPCIFTKHLSDFYS